MAKELCMLDDSDKGRQFRKYFIECEKQAQIPRTPSEQIHLLAQGYTQIDRGEIVVVGNVLPGVSGPLGVSNSPIVLGVETTNAPGSLGVGGKFTVGRDIIVSGVPGTGLNLIRALTNERAVLTGGISLATGTVLTLGAVSGSNVTRSGISTLRPGP